ncbi:MAG: pyruvate dehydrogenase (acetyl-transferring) E1 component subunit alpha [Geobacteraceae bacterium]|nr:pyruvate dehydrogenase (acetyl-transferring) E1 component subunit alpha [Geobacteraceae bacterium]
MPVNVIESLTVKRLEILDPQGNADEGLLPPLPEEEIMRMYELLVLSRAFDERALSLQREGRIGTYPSILGQEASQVGSALAIARGDRVFPSFRETGVQIALGYPIHLLLQYWGGDERGLRTPDGLNIFPICVSVGTHLPHAVGAALAARIRREQCAVIAYFGDGATSKGDFHEGFNMAGVFGLPVVFICQNNQWAISVPVERQTAAGTLARKAWAYGFEGVQVDGNDVFAVYRATSEALAKARQGGGPTFIECHTYRVADHTTADDASRYRSAAEVAEWRKRDPLLRLRLFMERKGLWTEEDEKNAWQRARTTVDDAVKEAESAPPPEPEELFQYARATLSPRQQRQLKEIAERGVRNAE